MRDWAVLLKDNVVDAWSFGPRFVMRHLRRSPMLTVPVRGVGELVVRRGSSDVEVIRQVFGRHDYDLRRYPQWQRIEDAYRAIIDRGRRPLIIDAGANNGATARWFADLFPAAKVVAVEPEPSNVEVCRANTADRDVEVLPMAIGGAAGVVELQSEGREQWAVATRRSDAGTTELCTVGDIVAAHSDRCDLFLVKIDIEGFESDLFGAATDWVRAAMVIFVEPHDWLLPGAATSRNFQRVLGGEDFEILISGENLLYIRRELSDATEPSDAREPTDAHASTAVTT